MQLFVDTAKKAGLAVAERSETFVVSLDPAAQRRCPAPPSAPRPGFGAGACSRLAADAKIWLNVKPDTSLDDLALWIAGITCKPVRFDPSIASRATAVTMIVPAQITAKQATRLFVDAVESTGLVVTEQPGGFEVKRGPRWAHCAGAAARRRCSQRSQRNRSSRGTRRHRPRASTSTPCSTPGSARSTTRTTR